MVQFKPEDWVIDRHNEILDAQQRGPLYVAVLRERGTDEVVGMCHGGAVRHDEDFKKVEGVGNRVELWTVSIKEEFLKVGGLGSMMLDDFFKWVRETSSQHTTPTTVMLISFECNLRSHRFYEKHGMRCAVVTSKMYSGRDTAIRVYTIDICSD
ncbi:hypothetical protein BC829DRAFT_176952 [Chytridium lagenaria]|nr:hypothetical protein BC829DRAFT_176952 [Chytridium lagenaria]